MAKDPSKVVAPALGKGVADFAETALTLDTDLTSDDWERIGKQLAGVSRGVNWWWGDWLNHGELKYRGAYAIAAELSGQEVQTLRNVAYVASKFDPSRRRSDLSWSHHAAVAGLQPAEADSWLQKAADRRWSVNALRGAVANARIDPNGGIKRVLDVPELNRRIATEVDRLLRASGMTQTEFAEAVYGNPKHQGSISRIKLGLSRPNLATLERMAQVFGTTVEAFGLSSAQTLPAKLVQQTARKALVELDKGNADKAREVLERLATALDEDDL